MAHIGSFLRVVWCRSPLHVFTGQAERRKQPFRYPGPSLFKDLKINIHWQTGLGPGNKQEANATLQMLVSSSWLAIA